MIQQLISFFNQFVTLDKQEIDYLTKHIPSKTYKKDTILLVEGAISKEFFFITSGCIRLYYNMDGSEKTAFFYTENQFVSSYESFTKQTPANHNIEAIEETTVLIFSQEQAMALLQQFPKFDFLARVMMEEELIIHQDIIASFIAMNPEERYLKLLKNRPDLIQRVPQYQLASYLGVKPESLSRIKKRISKSELS